MILEVLLSGALALPGGAPGARGLPADPPAAHGSSAVPPGSAAAGMLLASVAAPEEKEEEEQEKSEELFLAVSFDEACRKAQDAGKVVFIDFFTTWCAPCKQLDATTWKDAKVGEWLRAKTVPLKIDAEAEAELAGRYRITSYPTLLFLKPDGTELSRIVGYRDAGRFLSEGAEALLGRTAVDRAREQLRGHEDQVMLRQHLADALKDQGNYDEALKEYLFCFDEGVKDPSYAGVRLSFLLGDLVSLAALHPPAREALQARADAAEKLLRAHASPAVGPQAAQDLAALNQALGQDARTLALYDELRQDGSRNPYILSALFDAVVEELMEQERYEDVLDGAGNLQQRLQRHGTVQQYLKGMQGGAAQVGVDRTLHEMGMYLEALLRVGDEEESRRLADQLLDFDSSAATQQRLREIGHAVEAEDFVEWLDARIQELSKAESPEQESGGGAR